MIAETQMITARMMHIADHPSNAWLEEYQGLLGRTVFKFGDAKLLPKKPKASQASADIEITPKEFNAKDNFIKFLSDKVK